MPYQKITTALATCFLVITTVLAQDRSGAIQKLPQASRSAVATENFRAYLPTVDVANGRLDEELGILRAAYRLNPAMAPEVTPEATVRAWLVLDGDELGIHTPDVLELVRETETTGARHLTFQQTLAGVRVYGRFVHVNLGRDGLPVMATNGYAPHLEGLDTFNPVPAISVTQAESLARQAVSPDGATSSPPELLVVPDTPPRLVWRAIVWPDSYPGEWEVLLDAHTGALIRLMDQRIFSHPTSKGKHAPSGHTPDPPDSLAKADGEGYIWLFDPLTASGQSYGGDYVDSNDQDNATLNNLRKAVTLQDIRQNANGQYRLRGPWVNITGTVIPVETNPSQFKYTRSDDRFEAVMAYYYIDENQRYIQSLNTGHPVPAKAIRVDPHVTDDDQSFFMPARNFLGFGDGGADDAEDAGVILHEYGHAVMYHHLGYDYLNFGLNAEQNALSEGFSDYWAVSYRRHLMESGQVPKGDWRDVFPWDGIAWGGRRADGNENYATIRRACSRSCNFYHYGTTWAALMMELWGNIGRENTDRLHLAAFPYLGPNHTFQDMAEALLQADRALHSGQYSADIISIFQPKGFLPSQLGIPVITHVPIRRQFDLTSPVKFEADITVSGPPITRAVVNYRLDSGNFQSMELTNDRGTRWSAEILPPPSTSLLEYYLEVSTSLISVTSPKSAPDDLWTLQFGPDTQAPVITYTPVTHVTQQDALRPFSVHVTDNDMVSRVTLEYTVTYPGNQNTDQGKLPLSDAGNGRYTFSLPFHTSENILHGTWMEYRIVAYDAARPPNTTTFPSTGKPLLRLDVLPGANELARWQPGEWPGLPAGEWATDRDVFGYAGNVWVTAPGKSYSDQPALSLLSFPEINVAGYPDAQLEFWHWYDFEHADVPGPGDAGGTVYDGGQIQISMDGGQSWTVAIPQWGYNGTVDQTTSNPLSGTPAFGGSSLGWRRVRVPLPDAPQDSYRFEVHTRLAFGTGTGNTHSTTDRFAGWAVRDAKVFIDPPVNTTSPEIQRGPAAHQFVLSEQSDVSVQIVATDDPGIESVRLHLYDVHDAELTPLGTYRLVPLRTDPNRFLSAIPIPDSPPGSILGYHISVRDFDANIQTLGGKSAGELLKLYVPSEAPRIALTNARSSEGWTRMNGGYITETDMPDRQSSIVLSPIYFSTVSERTMLRLRHAYRFGKGSSGRVSVTEDGGTTWEIVPSVRENSDEDQSADQGFSGEMPETTDSWFDLTSLKQPFQLRLDIVRSPRRGESDRDFWRVFGAEYYRLAKDAAPVPVATDLILYPNFPNPFRDETVISYVLPESMNVRITLFNALGQTVQTVTSRNHEAGGYAINLNLQRLAAGTYWVRMEAGNTQLQQSITLVH